MSYVSIRLRYLYENEKAFKAYSDEFDKEVFIPKCCTMNYIGQYRRGDVMSFSILKCVAERKGLC